MRTAEEMDTEVAGKAILEELLERTFGSTTVVDGWIEVGPDHDDELALFVHLVLSDPPAGEASWPADDRRELRAEFGRAVRASGLGVIPYLSVESVRDPERRDNRPGRSPSDT